MPTTSSITATERRATRPATSPAGADYREQFASIDRPDFDELFAVGDRVVVAYMLQLHRQDGSTERMAVMAIWTIRDGQVVELCEVDAPAA